MRPILTSWIMGYLTASDRLAKDTFDQTPVMAPEALTSMIIGVCHRYPDARVETVANNVLNQLAAARVLHESPVVEARAGDRVVLIRQATLAAMQNTLVKEKLLKDPADGRFGSSTAAALVAFQKSQNLPETGLPDPSTVVRLLIEMPPKAAVKRTRTNR
jgi:peptidoglycan hydrolase-like protein with peptidoglycan-binding domain